MSRALLAARRLAKYMTVPVAAMLALAGALPAQAEPFPPYSKFQISYWTEPNRCVGWTSQTGIDPLVNHACDVRATWTYNQATQQLISNDNRCVDEWDGVQVLEVKPCDANRWQQRWEVIYTQAGYYTIHQVGDTRGLYWGWQYQDGSLINFSTRADSFSVRDVG